MAFLCIIFCVFIISCAFFSIVKSKITVNKDSDSVTANQNIYKIILKTKPFVLGAIVLITVIVGLFSSIYSTSEQEVGFTSTFGQNDLIETAGIHFKIPFVSEKHVFDGTTKGMPIGYTTENDQSVFEESLMITKDFNFVNIDFYLEYHITDPISYHYSTSDPEGLLKNIALAAIRNTVGQFDVDDVMTTGKSQIESKVFDDIKNELDKHKTGISVTNISIQDAEAPNAEVQSAFQAVEDAKQNAQTKVNEADKYTNEQLPAAEANAAEILASANATKTERVNQATEEVAKFEALYTEYSKNPDIVKHRLYLDALSDVLPNMEVIIGKDSKVVYVNGTLPNTINSTNVPSNSKSETIDEDN